MANQWMDQQILAAFLDQGQISSTDAKTALNKLFLYPTQEKLVSMFNAADKDYNGVMRFNEFKGMVTTLQREAAAEKYARDLKIVQELDTDGSGFIEKDEMMKFLKSQGVIVNDLVLNNIMTACDSTRDGKLNYVEFLRAMPPTPVTYGSS